ncbi:MAG: HigA family addiction module antidote protein [Synergistaceae bacterium]|nr:HigA family addiction module antidote protein [Synergistaceae bacterium]MBQ3345514.1 HigA family addiction module antidote protein [Synergistaceae bacterium]MBQ3398523.1 HigA family addiction module antidote protein [Synergistaceae bacterium]MBQ3759669.1 HigA family addiction module antidote protein [Synergistaceae bacterium]MBQ4400737.1 HigA family addiction module antidote protein [Synergistaceae bacterium]
MDKYIPTPTIGEIIVEEFLKPLNISRVTLARIIGLSEHQTKELLEGNAQVTPELSKRLSSFFGMSELFFYRLQQNINTRNAGFAYRKLALV